MAPVTVVDTVSLAALGRSRLATGQASAALRSGDTAEAERALRVHLLHHPNDANALAALAQIAVNELRMEEGALLLRRAASSDPSTARHLALASHLLAFAGPVVALKQIGSLPAPARSAFEVRAFEALLLAMARKYDEQLTLLQALLGERPADPVLWIQFGQSLSTVGRVDEAIGALRSAIRAQPSCGAAYWALASLKSYRFSGRDIDAMRKMLRGKLRDVDRLHFEFALARALEQGGRFSESFAHYAAGNRIRSAGWQPEQMQVTAFVDEAIATCGRALFARHAGAGFKAAAPIFVVGLHRSGTTLIEQILASHPQIEGAGELPVMQQIWDRATRSAVKAGRSPIEDLLRFSSADLEALGAEYLERSRPFRSTERRLFVDKLPANWLNVALIRLILPNAKIIDARRHPMACGFSNFREHYSMGVTYAYALGSIGRFYRDYLRLMNHFDAVQPGAVCHVVNERLIECPEREIRRMLDHVGVPFDAACGEFHLNKRAVNTPSAQQVRRPLNRDGVDAWRSYERWLGTLKDSLGSALDEWSPSADAGSRAQFQGQLP